MKTPSCNASAEFVAGWNVSPCGEIAVPEMFGGCGQQTQPTEEAAPHENILKKPEQKEKDSQDLHGSDERRADALFHVRESEIHRQHAGDVGFARGVIASLNRVARPQKVSFAGCVDGASIATLLKQFV